MNALRRQTLLAVLLLALAQSMNGANPEDSTFVFFPSHRLFPALLADGTAPCFSISKDVTSHIWVGSVGLQPRLLQVSLGNTSAQVSVSGAVHTSLLRSTHGGDVVTIDYFVDFLVDVRIAESLTLRTGYGHFSAHFADDWLDRTGVRSVNYVKEYFPLLAAYRLPALGGFMYGGVRFDHHSLPEVGRNWQFQCGTEVGNILLFAGMRAYAAVDLKIKSEVTWGTTQSYQVGLKLFERNDARMRTAFTYRTGIDDRGQLYRERIDLGLFGVYVDL